MSLRDTSKFISLILRHKPDAIGITLDEHGWANVDELIAGIAKQQHFDMAMLEKIVATDDKQRYSFNEDKTLIRANQGHSVPVDVELEQVSPPKHLYHGTGEKYVASIEKQGLIPKSRLYVHLSPDYNTAEKVGSRHGKPVIYCISAEKMAKDGYVFYKSVNGVWLTKEVPVKYFKRDSFDYDIVNEIAAKLREAFAAEDEDAIEELLIPQYSWEYVQQALFAILLDDNSTALQYDEVANVIWSAVLDGQKIRKTTAIALLYYRLGDINAPYENNTIWSIASNLLDLDYANAEYNPLKDEKIIKKLAFYGLSV